MNLKRGFKRDDGLVLNGYTKEGKPHWLSTEAFNNINERSRKTRWKNKLKVIAAYGGGCSGCGITDPIVLQVDHVFDNGKDHVDSKGRRITGNQLYSNIIKHKYPSDYQILCANCNVRKEWIRRDAYAGEEI